MWETDKLQFFWKEHINSIKITILLLRHLLTNFKAVDIEPELIDGHTDYTITNQQELPPPLLLMLEPQQIWELNEHDLENSQFQLDPMHSGRDYYSVMCVT